MPQGISASVAETGTNPRKETRKWRELHEVTDAAVAGGVENYRVPHILHQTGPGLDRVRPIQREFHEECRGIHEGDGWVHKFWDDAEMDDFVSVQYPDIYPQWREMEPVIRRVDTVRYTLAESRTSAG